MWKWEWRGEKADIYSERRRNIDIIIWIHDSWKVFDCKSTCYNSIEKTLPRNAESIYWKSDTITWYSHPETRLFSKMKKHLENIFWSKEFVKVGCIYVSVTWWIWRTSLQKKSFCNRLKSTHVPFSR